MNEAGATFSVPRPRFVGFFPLALTMVRAGLWNPLTFDGKVCIAYER